MLLSGTRFFGPCRAREKEVRQETVKVRNEMAAPNMGHSKTRTGYQESSGNQPSEGRRFQRVRQRRSRIKTRRKARLQSALQNLRSGEREVLENRW